MPGHKFTQAERAKASATRTANAAQRKLKRQQAVVATATTELGVSKPLTQAVVDREVTRFYAKEKMPLVPPKFDWWESALEIAVEKLNNMKREYDRAAQIVLQRQSQLPAKPLTCWVWDHRHRKDVSRSALAECRRTIPDRSKAAFTNDGYREEGDPPGKIRSIYACSMKCYMVYNQLRPVGGLSRH